MNNLPVVVIGAGGHAKVLIEALQRGGMVVLALTDCDRKKTGSKILGAAVGGDDEWLMAAHPPGSVRLVNGVGSTRQTLSRRRIFDRFSALGYSFVSVIHPSAVIASDVVIGAGAQVMAGVVIQPGVRLGVDSIVNTHASIDHDCDIGPHAHVAPGATLSGNVVVGESSHIGAGATVIQGIVVGRESLVAAGAVVVANVSDRADVAGIPARDVS